MAGEGAVAPGNLPDAIGRYRLRARLAGHAFGDVYEAFDPLLERPVIVKVFPLPPDDTAAARHVRDTFSREMQRVGLLMHPGIVALFDAGQIPGAAFMANEFVDGQTLADLIAAGVDLDLPLRVSLLLQIVDALEYASDLDVLHLDLKPSNIRVTADFMLKVGSFGVGPLIDALADAAGIARPLTRYAAPERVRGETATLRADVFSLAAIALDLLWGHSHPPDADGPAPIDLPPYLSSHGVNPERWAALFSRAFEVDPAERFSSAAAFSVDLLLTLNLGEAEARLAWETSRTLGVYRSQDPEPIAGPSDTDGATMMGDRPSRGNSTTGEGAARPAPDGDSETFLGPGPPGPSTGRGDR